MKAATSSPHTSAHHASQATAASGAHRQSPSAKPGAPPDDAFAGLMHSLAADENPALEACGDEASPQEPAAALTLAAPIDPPTQASPPAALVQSFAGAISDGTFFEGVAPQVAEPAAKIPTDGASARTGGRDHVWPPAAGSPPPALNPATPLAMADPRPPGWSRPAAFASATSPPGVQTTLPTGPLMSLPHEPLAACTAASATRDAAMALADTRRPDAAGAPPSSGGVGVGMLELAAASAPSVATGGLVHEAEMTARPQEAAFASELAAQVELMVDGDLHVANLRLNPVDLGPIRIELRIDGTTADVIFSAAHELTREGITRSLEELRDMLAGQGLSLGQTEVGARHGGQGRDASPNGHALGHTRSHSQGTSGAGDVAAASSSRPRALRGMLDLYA